MGDQYHTDKSITYRATLFLTHASGFERVAFGSPQFEAIFAEVGRMVGRKMG
jgi:hypothetical protein